MTLRKNNDTVGNRAADTFIRWMERLEQWGYVTAGLSFLMLGMGVFAHGWYDFFASVRVNTLQASFMLINNLLLVIILLELFSTVVHFLKTHVISLEPFLSVVIVASIRHILMAEAYKVAQPESLFGVQHGRYLFDVGVNTAIIVALVFAVFLYRKTTNPWLREDKVETGV